MSVINISDMGWEESDKTKRIWGLFSFAHFMKLLRKEPYFYHCCKNSVMAFRKDEVPLCDECGKEMKLQYIIKNK